MGAEPLDPNAGSFALARTDLIEAFGVASWACNLQTGALVFDKHWEPMLGAPPADAAALRRACHPRDLPAFDAALARHLAGQTARTRAEMRVRHEQGHYVWVECQGAVTSRCARGQPEWVCGFVNDISARKQQEDKWRRGRPLLEQTSRLGAIGGWEIDLSSGEMYWTDECFRIAGLPMTRQPTAAEALAFYAPEAQARIKAARHDAASTGTPYEFEVRYNRADGRQIWVRSVGAAVFEDGRAVRLVGAMQDVSEQVAQRMALQEAYRRTTLAANSGGIGLFDWDVVADTLYWDEWMCRLHGIARPDVRDTFRIWTRQLHPDDRQAAEAAVRDAIAGIRPYDIEFRVIWPDGSVHYLHAIGTVLRDAAGHAHRIVGTNRDMTQHREMTAALSRQHEMLRVTMQSIGDAVVTTDAHGRIGWLNPLAERLTGWAAAEAAGRLKVEVVRLIDETTREDRPDLVPMCLKLARVMSQAPNALMVSRHGVECPIENTLSPIRDASGEVLGVVIVFRDVSFARRIEAERREREHQLHLANTELERLARHFAKARNVAEQASRAKTRFLAGMSHELRTPLNGILGYAQLLRMDGGLTEIQSTRLQAMLSAGTHLLEMISCVLDLSEIETDNVELQMVPVDIAGLADAVINIVRPAAEGKSLCLRVVIAPDVPRVITTDPARLRQILLNLLGNAVKYTETGSVELHIHRPPPDASLTGGRFRFEVIDTGTGIDPEQRHHLFGAYDRLGAEGSAIEGAGLGLALGQKLAELLGGRLDHADRMGGGSVFWFELPECQEESASPATHGATSFDTLPPLAAVPTATGRRILIVDDVAMNRDIAAAFVRSAGYEVVCAEGGAEAVDAAANGDFIVILMDVRMPGIDGLEATRRIRALEGPRGRVHIVALTAQVFTEQVQACREAGMDTHLTKPYTLEALLGAIARGVAASVATRPGELDGVYDFLKPEPQWRHLAILDKAVFTRTIAVLEPRSVQICVASLSDKVQVLLDHLKSHDGSTDSAVAMAEAAHGVAGSAGMLGLERLTFYARYFEMAVRADAAQAAVLSASFAKALSESLEALGALM